MAALPGRPFLRASLALWKRREKYRKRRHDHWQRLVDKTATAGNIRSRDHWSRLLATARAKVRLRQRQLGSLGPVRGFDVSNNNGHVDFAKAHAAGYRFVWLKASEGTSFTDRFFLDNVRRAKAAGLKVGAYHFLNQASASAQANHFAALVRKAGLGKGDLLPVADVEKEGVSPALGGAFVSALRHELGVSPLIYTFPGFANPWPSKFGCKLWIAHFGASRPTIPGPWSEYAAWQHSSTASVPGVSGNADVNVAPGLDGITW